ncbi:electron transport complex subunit RsxC [Wenzhouxiangella marina]|uniref:Ion-translocating oxidoreductase complex subunit C n=1 Tax=Wenzhouxiangella marina TaxID=1579979 RepID=A0A0K0XVG7_9GAMM|nr:electron transport complex subunit RsxC [Wenzhouxiangella marina]AKS41665.1 Electron transport complex subunit C [Wenzhouxiangella marina]MBB6086574.1 electron transport complex protein RnfC [Wenzhouxiangella marina]
MSDSILDAPLHAFPGGLRLDHHKTAACESPPARAPLPERLYLPLVDRRGQPVEACVREGDRVARGEVLIQASSDFELTTHAPTSGRIGPVEFRPAVWPPGHELPCLSLIADGEDRAAEPRPLDDWQSLDRDRLVDQLRDAGLAGLGGAAFPTAAKLRGDWDSLDTLILNGAECEPWIACDEALMRSRAEAIVLGGQILARACGARELILAIEDPLRETESRLHRAMAGVEAGLPMRLVKVPSLYPEGGERQLIQVLTGREVPFDGLPQDLGVLVHNVATAAAAHDAVVLGLPLTERIVTVTGPGIASPCNLIARIGTPIAHLLETAGGLSDDCTRLILGGPMSGTALVSDRIPVTKGTNCLLALTEAELQPRRPVMPCINCGECVRVCPARLLPQQLYRLIEGERLEAAAELDLFDCIECGCCAQVCPSQIPLVDWYRHGKAERRIQLLDQRRAALARRRHEAREKRLAIEEAEREARRERRRQKLAQGDQARNEIQAAIERARARKRGAD